MQMNPIHYFNSFVKPNYDDFCQDEGSVRKAFNSVVSLAHMADNYFNFYDRRNDSRVSSYSNLEAFKIYVAGLSSYCNDVQSMANAYKHLYTNSGRAHVTVASGGSVFVEEYGDEDNCESNEFWASGCYVVYYNKKDAIHIKVKDALDDVIKMWEGILL